MASQTTTHRAVQEILRLRQSERAVDADLREELRSTREFLEEIAGPTVSRAEASRLLGLSQTALDRWIAKDEISVVLTPSGRREIPLAELVELLEEVNAVRNRSNRQRPLASVIRERRRRSSESVDLERLLPRRGRRGHRVAELKGLAYHRLVAERMDEHVVADAQRRLRRWREEGRIDPRWAAEWEQVLQRSIRQIAKAIGADNVRGSELRQTSPFVGVLSEQERRELGRAVETRALR